MGYWRCKPGSGFLAFEESILEECGRAWSCGLQEPSRASRTVLAGSWKTVIWTVESWLVRFLHRTRTLLGTELEVMQVTFWRKTWLYTACVFKI